MPTGVVVMLKVQLTAGSSQAVTEAVLANMVGPTKGKKPSTTYTRIFLHVTSVTVPSDNVDAKPTSVVWVVATVFSLWRHSHGAPIGTFVSL